MIQFIASGFDALGRRVVLWRKGDYHYEVETMLGLAAGSRKVTLACSYEEAVEDFEAHIGLETA